MSAVLITTNGIVIRERPVGEFDKYAEILTRDVGIIEALVRGARKMTSKNGAATQLLTYSRICVDKTSRDRYVLNSSQVINTFYNIRLDMKKLALTAYLSDLLRFTTPPEENAENVLRLFLNTLYFLDKGNRDNGLLKTIFELRLMCEIGLMPQLIGCYNCYLPTDSTMYFEPYDGKLICKNCYNSNLHSRSYTLDESMLHTIRYICLCEFEKIFNFKISENCQRKLTPICENYIKIQLNKAFQTLEFYKKI